MLLVHPYRGKGQWLKGNLHSHTTNSDGKLSLSDLVKRYEQLGYDFLAVTDHDKITPLDDLSTSLILIQGSEITSGGGHTVALGIKTPIEPKQHRQNVLDDVKSQGGITILAHPNWGEEFCHWKQDDLMNLNGYTAIEVFNGIVLREPGNPTATDRWDMLLSKGKLVWGYANDDTHDEIDIANGWTMVLAEQLNLHSIIQSLISGRCYASSGVLLESIEVDENYIRIVFKNAERISFIGKYGRWLKWVNEKSAEYELKGNEGYVRVEAYGSAGSAAWLQPIFVQQ